MNRPQELKVGVGTESELDVVLALSARLLIGQENFSSAVGCFSCETELYWKTNPQTELLNEVSNRVT